jgi:hypothetical protein
LIQSLFYSVFVIIYSIDVNAKYMKLLYFTFLSLVSLSSYSVEFSRCIDDKGQVHFTNMPLSNLDSNCAQKVDHYVTMLNQDYENLANEFKKYEEPDDFIDDIFLEDVDLSINSLTQPVKDILDPDKALEQLLESTEDRDDPVTRAFRGRSEGIERIMDQAKPSNP